MAEQEGRALAEKLQSNIDENQNSSEKNKFEEEEQNEQLESVEESKNEADQ